MIPLVFAAATAANLSAAPTVLKDWRSPDALLQALANGEALELQDCTGKPLASISLRWLRDAMRHIDDELELAVWRQPNINDAKCRAKGDGGGKVGCKTKES